MNAHASAEALSAYLDHQLQENEARQLELHLEGCEECHLQLEGLRRVVTGLHRLDSLAPPQTLDQDVVRRIALSGEKLSLLDRVEEGASIFRRQSSLLGMFAIVIALAMFMLFFSIALERHQNATIPVIFEPPAAASAPAGRLEVAGRVLLWQGERWVEEGLSNVAAARVVVLASPEGDALLAAHPELAAFARVEEPLVVRVGEEVLELR